MGVKLDFEMELLNLKHEIEELKKEIKKLQEENTPRLINPVYRYDARQGKVINIHEKGGE